MSNRRTSAHDTWAGLLQAAHGAFGAPSFGVFSTLLCGWVIAPGRRTITAMICAGDPEGRRSHDTYHRLVRCARWSTELLSARSGRLDG